MVDPVSTPTDVLICEVGPRDGLQNESTPISTDDKVWLVDALSASGLRRIEVTSFVSPRAVPQMADASEVMRRIRRDPGVEYAALIPNRRGLERAMEAKVDIANLVIVASETFNRRNVNMTIAESMNELAGIATELRGAATRPNVVIGTAFHCPFEGATPAERVLGLVEQCVDLGIGEVTLADTIGAAMPSEVIELGRAVKHRWPELELGLHIHDTRGMGVANALAAIQGGYVRLESSVGGIGGCPFAPNATGNACTEELVFMLQGFGLSEGVSLPALIDIAAGVSRIVGRPLESGMLRAGIPGPISNDN